MELDLGEIFRRKKVRDILRFLLYKKEVTQTQILQGVRGNTEKNLRALDIMLKYNLITITSPNSFPYNTKLISLTSLGINLAKYIERYRRFLNGHLPKERQRVLVRLFRYIGKSINKTEIQKLVFLLNKEYNLTLDKSYSFEPYLFGPFSREIESDLYELEFFELLYKNEKIGIFNGTITDWNCYYLSDLGRAVSRKISTPEHIIDKYVKLRKKFSHLSLKELIDYVYLHYPEFTKNSLISNGEEK